MKKYFLRFAIAFLTFAVGIGFAASWFSDFFFYKPLANTEAREDSIKAKQTEGNQELTFESIGIIDIVWTGRGEPPPYLTIYKASDKTEVRSESRDFKTEKSARKRFNQEIDKADKIIELSPCINYWNRQIGEKAFVESGKKVFILKYTKVWAEKKESYKMTIDKTPSLRHAVAFEKWDECSKRGLVLNQLKP